MAQQRKPKFSLQCKILKELRNSPSKNIPFFQNADSRFLLNTVIRSTVLCKSNANNNRRISRFVLAIYRRYISETSHGLPNVKMINHRDIGTIFAISRRDIVLARLRCNDISQSKRYITTIYRCSEVRCNDNVVVNCASTIYRNEAIVYDESVFVYM